MSNPLNLAKNQEDKSTGCCKFVCDMMKKFCRLLKDFSCKQPAYAFRIVKGSERQRGRTMVEMLGVLAIIGILSIGGISLLRLSMNHHHANQAADDVERLALVVYEQFEDLPKGEIGEENRAEFNGNAIFEYIAVKDSSSSFYIDVPGIRDGQCSALLPKAQDKHKMAVVIKKKNGLDAYVKEFEKDVTKPKDLCQFAKEDGTKFKEEEIAAENLEKEITVRFYFNGNPTCADGCPVTDLCNGCCCEGLSEGSSFCLNDVRDRLGDGVTRQERCCPKGTANCGGRCVDECDDGTEIDPETCTCKGECNPLDCPDYNPECCDTYACNPVEIAHCVDYDYKAIDNECPCKECEEGFELEGGICVKIKLCKKTYPGDKVCPRDEECLDYGNDFDGDTQCCKCDNWLCKLDPDGCQLGECICAEWNSAETFGQKGQCCPCSKFKCHMPNNPDTCATYNENFTSRECSVCPSECKDGYQKKDDGHCYAICNTNGVDEARRVTGVLSDEVCADFTCPCAGNREERVVNGLKGCYCKYDANEDIARGCVRHDLENTGDNVCPCNQWRCVMPEVGSPDYNPCCVVRDNNKKWEEPNKACPCIADLSETGVSIGGQKYTEWGPNSNNTLCVRNCVDVNVDHCSSDGYEITKSWVYQNSPHDVVYCECNKYDCVQGNPDALCRAGSEHTSTTYTSTQVSNNGGVVPYCPCDCQCNMPNGNVDSALRILITTGTNQQACSATDCACLDSYIDEVRACPPNTTTKQCYCKENTISGCKEYDICSTSATGCPCASCFCVAPQNYSSSNDPHREKPTETVKEGALKDEDGTCYTSISNDEWTASKWKNAKCGCLTDSNGKELEDRKGADNVYRCYCKKRDAEHMPTGCVQNEYSFENADDGYCPCSVYACVEPKKSTDAGYNPCCKKYDTNQTFGTADNPCPCENGYDMSDDSVGLTISGTKYTGWKKSSDNKTCERVCANINNCPVLPEPENLPKWVYQTSPNEPVACPCQDGTCPCVMPMDTEQQKMRNNAATIDPVNGVCPTTENDNTRCPCNSGWDDDETNHLCQKACIEKGVPYSLSEGDCTCTSELIVKYTATQIENNNGVVPYCECDNTTRECPCLMPEPLAQVALRDETKIWDEPSKKCPCPDRCPESASGVCTCPQPCNNPPCGTGVCVEHLCTNNDCGANCQTSYATSATCLIPHCVAIGSTAPYPCIACEDGYIVMQSGDCAKCVPIPEMMVAGACGVWGICDPDSGFFGSFCTYSRSAVCKYDNSDYTGESAYFKNKHTYGVCNPLVFLGKASVSNSENRRFIYNMMGSVSAATAKSYCKAQGQAENQDGTKGYVLGTEQDLLSVKDKNGIKGQAFWVTADDFNKCTTIHAVKINASGDLESVASPSPEHTRAFCDAECEIGYEYVGGVECLRPCTSWTAKGTANGGCPDGFFCYFDNISPCADPTKGYCMPITSYTDSRNLTTVSNVTTVTPKESTDGHKWVRSTPMNWWSAQSFCVSQGQYPAVTESIGCYPGTSCSSTGYANLKSTYTESSNLHYWLENLDGTTCTASAAEVTGTNVIGQDKNEGGYYALCDLGCPDGTVLNNDGVCEGEPEPIEEDNTCWFPADATCSNGGCLRSSDCPRTNPFCVFDHNYPGEGDSYTRVCGDNVKCGRCVSLDNYPSGHVLMWNDKVWTTWDRKRITGGSSSDFLSSYLNAKDWCEAIGFRLAKAADVGCSIGADGFCTNPEASSLNYLASITGTGREIYKGKVYDTRNTEKVFSGSGLFWINDGSMEQYSLSGGNWKCCNRSILSVVGSSYATDSPPYVFSGWTDKFYTFNGFYEDTSYYIAPLCYKEASEYNTSCNTITNCSVTDLSTCRCIICDEGSVLNDDGTCAPPTPIDNCLHHLENSHNCFVCEPGYYVGNGSGWDVCEVTDTTIANCKIYYGNLCSACESGYMLSGGGTSCVACPANCESCVMESGKNECRACASGYQISDDYLSCVKCTSAMDHCVKVGTNANSSAQCTCSLCASEFGVSLDGTTCEPCMGNCTDCMYVSGVKECYACADGYEISSNRKSCVDCSAMSHCRSLRSQTNDNNVCLCQDCEDGYELRANDTACCTPVENCAEYSGDVGSCACTECMSGWVLNATGTACVKCPDNCYSCSYNSDTSEAYCETCDDGYIENEAGSGCFVIPPIEGCTEYEYKNGVKCKACIDGYAPNSTGTACSLCSSLKTNCSSCHRSGSSVVCDSCASGYRWNGSSCSKCSVTNCSSCPDSASSCDSCISGYRLVSNTCTTACTIANCSSCYMDGTTEKCEYCIDGFTVNTKNYKSCATCPDNCNSCYYNESKSKTECNYDSCADGFILNSSGQCVEASIANCKSYYYDGGVKCSECNEGYVKNSNDKACVACPANCREGYCSYNSDLKSSECSECVDGFIPTSNRMACAECSIANCLKYSYSSEINSVVCNACEEGFRKNTYENATACVQCPSNCQICTTNDEGSAQCSQCEIGYGLNDNYQCNACPANCDHCDYGVCADCTQCTLCSTEGGCSCYYASSSRNITGGDIQCKACSLGYIYNPNTEACVELSLPHCLNVWYMVYQPTPSNYVYSEPYCMQCEGGYTLDNGSCVKD